MWEWLQNFVTVVLIYPDIFFFVNTAWPKNAIGENGVFLMWEARCEKLIYLASKHSLSTKCIWTILFYVKVSKSAVISNLTKTDTFWNILVHIFAAILNTRYFDKNHITGDLFILNLSKSPSSINQSHKKCTMVFQDNQQIIGVSKETTCMI